MLTIRISRRIAVLVVLGLVLAIPAASLASHRFTDVPDANIFHDDISWLADAGVTLGCNPPANDQFCPSDNVTREQMSAFMRRFAAYLGAEDGVVSEADHAATADLATAATDADTLDGQHASAFVLKTDVVARTITLPSSAFTPRAGNTEYFKASGTGGAYINGSAPVDGLTAPLALPHGSRITEVQYRYLDNSAAGDLSFSISREFASSSSFMAGIAAVSTSGQSSDYRTATVAPDHVVSAEFGYAVSAFSSTWETEKQLLRVKSVQITYELPG